MPFRFYTPKEDAYLRTHRATQTNAQMAAALDRTAKSVKNRCIYLRIFADGYVQKRHRSPQAIAKFKARMAERRAELIDAYHERHGGWPKPCREPERAWTEAFAKYRVGA